MGIDLIHKHRKSTHRKVEASSDPYLHLLIKLYKFLARRTKSPFNAVVLKRLKMARRHRIPVSLSKIDRVSEPLRKTNDKVVVVVVGTVVNDARLIEFPKTNVCAMRFTTGARERITKNGGRALTFDQLALERPTGANTVLLQGARHNREACRHFRGLRGSKTAPRVRGQGKAGFKITRGGERTHTRKKY